LDKTLLKAQIVYMFKKCGGYGPFGPLLATPMIV